MDLFFLLKLIAMGVIVLLMLYIVSIMARAMAPKPAKPKPKPVAKVRNRCEGARKGEPCGKALFQCGNCRERGCEMIGCDNQGFEAPGDCLRCGYGNTKEPL